MSPRPPRADSARNREALLDAATALLRENFDAPLDAIAAAAGLTRRAVYGHFPSRDDLVAAMLERGAARIAGAVGEARDEPPLHALARLGGALWDQVAEVRAFARAAVATPHAAFVARGLAPVRERMRGILERAAARGEVRTDVGLTTLALLVERAALDVLEVTGDSPAGDARLLAMTHPLCAAGVGGERALEVAHEVDAA
ncbi:TetR/AcrR family transcriptional regulator [Demequina pelophila]|uniref:TetR/AcrR family transcriptional regulator n=1 Tax=Demequina pelophila TaxID=1638984 RepID=UPI000782525B|nr:TetR/AcrR family transcriptional regulator [Demequina pelophila]